MMIIAAVRNETADWNGIAAVTGIGRKGYGKDEEYLLIGYVR